MQKRKDEIEVKMNNGKGKTVPATICDDLFAVHKSCHLSGVWDVTHLPTGLKVSFSVGFGKKRDALAYIQAILPLHHWLIFNVNQLPTGTGELVKKLHLAIADGQDVSDELRAEIDEFIAKRKKREPKPPSYTEIALQTDRNVSQVKAGRKRNESR